MLRVFVGAGELFFIYIYVRHTRWNMFKYISHKRHFVVSCIFGWFSLQFFFVSFCNSFHSGNFINTCYALRNDILFNHGNIYPLVCVWNCIILIKMNSQAQHLRCSMRGQNEIQCINHHCKMFAQHLRHTIKKHTTNKYMNSNGSTIC